MKKRNFDAQTGNGSNETMSETEMAIHNETLKYLTGDLTQADSEKEVQNWMIVAIVVTVVAVILLLILLVLRKRIKLVVQLFKEAGKAVHAMPLILLQPFWVKKS